MYSTEWSDGRRREFSTRLTPGRGEKLLEELGFDDGVKSSSTPGQQLIPADLAKDTMLDPAASSKFRAHAARANYLAADRPDLQFAAKEVCRDMATPPPHFFEQCCVEEVGPVFAG